MRSIVMTGACGFIGSNMVHYWNRKYPNDRVIVLDKLSTGSDLYNLKHSNSELIIGDICDTHVIKDILESTKPFAIIHFAAQTHVDRSIIDPYGFVHTNVLGTLNLLETLRKSNNNIRFLHVSTDEVYGTLSLIDPPFTEESQYAPNSPYSASKAASDHLVRSYYHTYNLPVLTTNCSNNYGPRQATEKFIPRIIYNALNFKPLPIYGTGLNIRDWLYVTDHCKALEIVLLNGEYGNTYNVGGGCELNNVHVVHLICKTLSKLTGVETQRYTDLIDFVEDRPGHDLRYAVNAQKIEKKLGWKPETNFEDGLEETVKYYMQIR